MAKKIKKVKTKPKKVVRSGGARKPKKNEVALLKQQLAKLKRDSNAKDAEMNRLREEVEYKNRQLASKDVDMETDKKATEEKIFQLEAKVKELEGKIGGSSLAL
jgi:hypothetical protein